VTGRSYLSIGDVLTLLREEFPDVTISKIRFLESQGLVNPERSPSGYRKFFEADVERLRWVLRQQREHFLPLKVIRDRLSEGDTGDDLMDEVPEPVRRNGKVPQPAHAAAESGSGSGSSRSGLGAGAPGSAGVSGSAGTPGSAGAPPVATARTEEQMAKANDEAMARILADASRRAALIPESGSERAPLRVVTDGEEHAAAPPSPVATTTVAPAPPTTPPPPSTVARPAEKTGVGAESPAAAAGASGGRPSEPGRMKASAPGGGAAPKSTTEPSGRDAAAAAAPKPSSTSATSGMVTGASLTAEELCSATGLSEIELAGLQGFGLIEAEVVAGILTFNEEALTVANLAADFRKFGIEPRHLRLYRNAVDRELGLIEQVIIPLLRQRNPESRQRAVDSAAELGALGQTMRATMLRSALRRHLGG
jgi:DNA-binding transcriptional MerR regulator